MKTSAEAPSFVAGSAVLRGAYELALQAHHGPAREGDTTIDHPTRVACLLHESGFEESVVAAALLHDVIEDTAIDLDDIEARFGYGIARPVGQMTEDESIEPYEARKREHRTRITHDRRVAAIYAADKLANARTFNESVEQPDDAKLEHYRRTLGTLRARQPDLPFLEPLQEELQRLLARRSREVKTPNRWLATSHR
jgi:(p)ppGpp synthase/HD superfamily hydrolase